MNCRSFPGGMYIIGTNSTGVAINSTLRSWVDGGAVSSSGGHIIGIDSSFTGRAGFRNRGGATGISTFDNCAINCSNTYAGTVTMFEGRPYEQTIDFAYNVNFDGEDAAKYISNNVDGQRLSIFELSLPGSIYRNTAENTLDTAKYDNMYCGAGANGYNGIWNRNDAFASPYCWSTGESASYVTCFEFESSSITLDLTNCTYEIENTYNDLDSDAAVRDFDFLAVSEFGSNPTLNFIDHDETITGATKYSQDMQYRYCIVPGALDGKPVAGFGTDNVLYRSELYSITFMEGIERFAYQALYDLNGCQIGILPSTAVEIDEGFVRSMPAVTWGIHPACDAARDFVDESRYSYEFINIWEQANIDAMTASSSASGEASMGSGEPS